MSLHRPGDNKETQNETGAQQERPNTNQSDQTGRREQSNVNTSKAQRNDGPLLTKSFSTGLAAGFIESAREVLKANETVMSRGGQLEWLIQLASAAETSMLLDAAIVAVREIDSGEIFASTLVFVGNKVMPKQPINIARDVTIRFSTTANDQYMDPGYIDSLNSIVHKVRPNWNGGISHIGCQPVTGDKKTEGEFDELVLAAINQVDAYVQSLSGVNAISIEDLNASNTDLAATIAFHQGEVVDEVTALPHRSDVRIEVTRVKREDRTRRDTNVLSAQSSRVLTVVNGHVDLVYMGPAEAKRTSIFSKNRNDRDADDTRIYGANLVISKLFHQPTPEFMVLSLAQLPALIKEKVLLTGLRPTGNANALRTAEAMTYELSGQFEKLPEALSDKEWLDVASNLIREDGQFVTLQVARSGQDTPLHRILIDACDVSNPDRRQYADILIAAADKLTGNRFSTRFANNDLYDIGERKDMPVLLGTWVDHLGATRDLREIGYFEILTHFGLNNPDVVTKYEECLHNTALDIQVRLDILENIISDYTGGHYKIIDRADAVELNTNWLFALTDACQDAGMVVTADGITQDTAAYNRGYSSRYNTREYEGSAFQSRARSNTYGFGRGR